MTCECGGYTLALIFAHTDNTRLGTPTCFVQDKPAVLDASKAGIFDSFPTKRWGLHFATNAACTVLRVDQIIMAKKAGGPKMAPQKGEHMDAD